MNMARGALILRENCELEQRIARARTEGWWALTLLVDGVGPISCQVICRSPGIFSGP